MSILWMLGRAIKRELEKGNSRSPYHKQQHQSRSSNRFSRDDEGEYVDFEEVK